MINCQVRFNIPEYPVNSGFKNHNCGTGTLPYHSSGDVFTRISPKSALSFGWCEPHVNRSTRVSAELIRKINAEIEAEIKEDNERLRSELLELESRTALEIAGFMLDFVNKQKNEAEFIPLWVIKNTPKIQEALDSSKIASDPVLGLVMLNGVQKFKPQNISLNKEQLDKSFGSVQLHTAAVLLEQIEQNVQKSQILLTNQDKQDIKDLCRLADQVIDKTYGRNTRDKIKALCTDKNLSDDEKKATRDLLVDIDNKARPLDLGEEFTCKLKALLSRQQEIEKRKLKVELGYKRKVIIGVPLSAQLRADLEKKLKNSTNNIQKEAIQLMLDTNREIRFNVEKLSDDQIHMREHLLDHGHVHHKHSHIYETQTTVNISHHSHEHEQAHLHKHS